MFGERLKMARLAADMTQRDLAEKIFVSHQAVGKWERGEATPNPETIVQIAQLLGISSSELLGDVAPLRDSAVRLDFSDTQRLTVSEVELILAYRRADERTRAMVQLALEPFAEKTATTSAG